MRRTHLAATPLLIPLLAILFLLDGCRRREETPVSRTAAPRTVIRVIGEDYSPMQGLEKVKGAFTQETGIDVEILRFDAETVRKKSIAAFQAGAPTYDVVMGAFYDVGLFAANGWVLDLGKELTRRQWWDTRLQLSDFSPAILDLCCRYRRDLYALPCSAQTMFLWYRKDLFEDPAERAAFQGKYGYPLPQPSPERSMTWRQYRDVVEFFTRPKGATLAGARLQRDVYGTVLQAKNHVALWFEFGNFLHSFGSELVDADGAVTADSPRALAALEYYIGLKKYSPPGTTNYTWDEALSAFQTGQVAVAVMWSDAIQAVEDPKASDVAGKVGYSAVPTVEPSDPPVAVFGGWGLFVNRNSRHPAEAAKLIQWANLPQTQLAWAKVGGIPANSTIYDSPEYVSLPGAKAHAAALQHLVGWSTEPFSARMIEVGQNSLSKAVSGELPPDKALSELAARLRDITAQRDARPRAAGGA